MEKEIKLDALKLIAESYGFELVKKERKKEIGNFGKYWSDNEKKCNYGFLTSKAVNGFFTNNDTCFAYANFAHLTDEEKQAITENW